MRILGDGGSRTGVRTPQGTKLQEAGSRVTGNDTLGEQIESLTLLVVDLEWRKIALVANAGRESTPIATRTRRPGRRRADPVLVAGRKRA